MATSVPRNPFVSPRFGQIATFMLLPSADSAKGLDVALLGIPYDGGTSYRTGARFGPRAVREQSSLIRPWNPVLKVHPFEKLRVADCGDVDTVPISIERTLAQIDARVSEVIRDGAMPVCVGGDHSVTLGILRAVGTPARRVLAVFLIQGGVLGVAGSLIGSAFGVLFAKSFEVLTADAAGAPRFAVQVDLPLLLGTTLLATGVGLLAAVIPARRAAGLDPAAAIHSG